MIEKNEISQRACEGLIAVTSLITAGVSVYSFYNYSHLMSLYIGIGIGASSVAGIAAIGVGAYYCGSSFWKKDINKEFTEDHEMIDGSEVSYMSIEV